MMKTAKEFGSDGWQDRCANIENDSVKSFLALCKEKGWPVRKSSSAQDKFSHIDYFVTIKGREYSVDIKGEKRYSDKGFILVEILNVMGNRGWLLGKADLVAFKVLGRWLIVPRNNIFRIIKEKMDLEVFTKGRFSIFIKGERAETLPCLAPKWYARADRPRECVTYLQKEDLERFAIDIVAAV